MGADVNFYKIRIELSYTTPTSILLAFFRDFELLPSAQTGNAGRVSFFAAA